MWGHHRNFKVHLSPVHVYFTLYYYKLQDFSGIFEYYAVFLYLLIDAGLKYVAC